MSTKKIRDLDTRCPVCGEPCEPDELYNEADTRYGVRYQAPGLRQNPNWDPDEYLKVLDEVSTEWRQRGCEVLRIYHVRY